VIRVGLARTLPSYDGILPPYGPGKSFPELEPLLGPHAATGAGNHVYDAVRAALYALGLDAERYGSAEWNPIGALARRGARIVLKPNFIRHWNPVADATVASVITHGSILRARAEESWKRMPVLSSSSKLAHIAHVRGTSQPSA